MSERKDSLLAHKARQGTANRKVKNQEGVVRQANSSVFRRSKEQLLLNETRHNKASADLNRAIFDYTSETEKVDFS